MHKVCWVGATWDRCWMLSQGQAHVQQGMGDHNPLTSLTLLWPPSTLWAMFEVATSKPHGTPGIYKAQINTPLLSDLGSFWSLSGFVGRTWLFCVPELLRLSASPWSSRLAWNPAGFKLFGCRRHRCLLLPIPCRINISRDVWVGGVEWPGALQCIYWVCWRKEARSVCSR